MTNYKHRKNDKKWKEPINHDLWLFLNEKNICEKKKEMRN